MKPNVIWKHNLLIEDAEPFMNGKDINLYYGLFSRVVLEGYQHARNLLSAYTRTLLYHL